MKSIFNLLFPKTVDNSFNASKITIWVFRILALISCIRSLIHLLSNDGGAGTIAGLDLSSGSENIIFAFSLWGLSQLIYAFIQLLVAFRYNSLIPLFYLILIFETVGRMAIGEIKTPILLHGAPPGGIANYIVLPLALLMLIISLRQNENKNK